MSRGDETSASVRVLIAVGEDLATTLREQLRHAGDDFELTIVAPDAEVERDHDIAIVLAGNSLPAHGLILSVADDRSADMDATAEDERILDVLTPDELGGPQLLRSLRHAQTVHALRARLHESHERHELLLRATNDGIWEWDLASSEVHYSARWAELMGLTGEELAPQLDTWFSRVHRDDVEGLREAVAALQRGDSEALEFEHRIIRPGGAVRWVLGRGLVRSDDRSRPVALAGSLTDIDARKTAELDSVDELTGLPSRRVLIERLERSLSRAQGSEGFNFSVLFLNIDRFQRLNDSIGLDSADRLLVLLAERMRERVATAREHHSLLCRYGGDEFALLLEGHDDFAEAEALARTVLECLESPFELDDQSLETTASIGIANSHADYTSPSEVIRDANIATRKAKRSGTTVLTFRKTMQEELVDTYRTERQLREAIEREQFEVYYQPIVALGSCRLTGFEALVRWNHPRRGVVGPGEFIPLAEDTGLIIPLGRFVFHSACTQMAAWHQQYPDAADVSISINLSGHQLRSASLINDIEQSIVDTGINPEYIKIELTESTLIDEEEAANRILGRLRNRGIKLYIDDFGTGYSSLSYLHRFAIDGLKIDRSFVNTLGQNDRRAAIVPSIVGLAHNLGMRVVAEGVEYPTQARELNLLDCGEAQGYLYSRPVPAPEAAKLIERRILCDDDYMKMP